MYLTNEKMFSDVKQFALIFIPINWIVCLVVSIVLYFIFGKEVVMGYVLGTATSLLNFGLLMKNTTNVIQPQQISVKSKIFGANIFRLLISAIVLVVSFYVSTFNFYSTIAGLLVFKLILFCFVAIRYLFFKDKIEENDISGKEEIKDDVTA